MVAHSIRLKKIIFAYLPRHLDPQKSGNWFINEGPLLNVQIKEKRLIITWNLEDIAPQKSGTFAFMRS